MGVTVYVTTELGQVELLSISLMGLPVPELPSELVQSKVVAGIVEDKTMLSVEPEHIE